MSSGDTALWQLGHPGLRLARTSMATMISGGPTHTIMPMISPRLSIGPIHSLRVSIDLSSFGESRQDASLLTLLSVAKSDPCLSDLA